MVTYVGAGLAGLAVAGVVWWAFRSFRRWPQPPPGRDAASRAADDRLRFTPWSHGGGRG